MKHSIRLMTTVIVGVLLAYCQRATASEGQPVPEARGILQASGVRGGLVVHVGCGDGRLTAALRADEGHLVHGLDRDPEKTKQARAHIQSLGLYGDVTVDFWLGHRLPYADNLVNLVVVEARCEARDAENEILRILAPRGVGIVVEKGNEAWLSRIAHPVSRIGDGLVMFAKPIPAETDEWTHYLHAPDNNAVADDSVVGPPRRLQWVCPPRWSRSHEHLASLSAAVSAGGRLFCILDRGPIASVAMPPQWTLVARDAFNGVQLWQRPIESWEWHLRGFRSGPTDLPRRLVAVGDRVYVTLGYGQPVVGLDAATGKTLRQYDQTENAQEIVCCDGVLYLVIGEESPENPDDLTRRTKLTKEHGLPIYQEVRARTRVMAVDADSGRTLWNKAAEEVGYAMPTTLAVAQGRVFFQNTDHVICLDAKDGREIWRADRPVSRRRPSWTTSTLVVYDGVVLSADRGAPKTSAEDVGPQVDWTATYHHTVTAKPGELIAFSADTGRLLWSAPCRESFNSPVDVLVAGGLVWTGDLVRAADPGILHGRDPHTGEISRTRPRDQQFYEPLMGHARCYRHKATQRYLITGRSGVEFVDVQNGVAIPNHWIRGECQYGILPCNGLLYVPPHPCACFVLAKLNSFHALAARKDSKAEGVEESKGEARIEKGPAYGTFDLQPSVSSLQPSSWPTYRHDAGRSGTTAAGVPSDLKPAWESRLEAPLTAPVSADGRVYVASVDTYSVHALDAQSGRQLWQFRTSGRVDSPPTIWSGRVLFGSADGWVYCLRADDGVLVWRYRAAPVDRLIVADGRLESAWPVHGSVLVLPGLDSQQGVVYASAGRSSYLDGGIVLVRLDAQSGREISRTLIDSRDPETGQQPHPLPQPTSGRRFGPTADADESRRRPGISMPGALNDILSSQDNSVFMRHLRFTLRGAPQDETVPHLHSPAGFLDDSWWHRAYWAVGSIMYSGYGGWPNMAHLYPSGRLLVVDGTKVYGFGRDDYRRHGGSHAGSEGAGGAEYRLFVQDMSLDPRRDPVAEVFAWQQRIELHVRAMVLADKTLFVAGPKNPLSAEDPTAVWQGHAGGLLWAVSASTGERLAAYTLDSPPVFDGLIAVSNRLIYSAADGRVVCMGRAE